MWGLQAYFMKFATNRMKPESLFFYMAAAGLLLAPFAAAMTDFSRPINYGWRGAGAAAMIQVLNAIGALCIVYAMRFGKAIIVVPMTALAPVLTVVVSLVLYQVVPHPIVTAGLVAASIAMLLMAE
jgi:drug/metabolite transporter (DMT)-like permease